MWLGDAAFGEQAVLVDGKVEVQRLSVGAFDLFGRSGRSRGDLFAVLVQPEAMAGLAVFFGKDHFNRRGSLNK